MHEYASFVTVKTIFGEKVPVVTLEEYKDFCNKLVLLTIGGLDKRITALEEEKNSVPIKDRPEKEKIADWIREAEEEYENSKKEEKGLWKIGYKNNYKMISCNHIFEPKIEDKESDIRELTTSEAEEWFQQFYKEKPYAGLFKLYHKKYGEWVLYEEEDK